MPRFETNFTRKEWKHVREWLENHPEVDSVYQLLKRAVLEKTRFRGNGP